MYWAVIETDFGWVRLMGRGGKLVGVELPKLTREETLAGIGSGFEESPERFGSLPEQMRSYFAGEPVCFDCRVELEGVGDFERRALLEATKVPYGSVTTYGALAAAQGNPRAVRAIGNAMARNPIPIVIPCHRVIHADGRLGGFRGGRDMKRLLLALEGVDF